MRAYHAQTTSHGPVMPGLCGSCTHSHAFLHSVIKAVARALFDGRRAFSRENKTPYQNLTTDYDIKFHGQYHCMIASTRNSCGYICLGHAWRAPCRERFINRTFCSPQKLRCDSSCLHRRHTRSNASTLTSVPMVSAQNDSAQSIATLCLIL